MTQTDENRWKRRPGLRSCLLCITLSVKLCVFFSLPASFQDGCSRELLEDLGVLAHKTLTSLLACRRLQTRLLSPVNLLPCLGFHATCPTLTREHVRANKVSGKQHSYLTGCCAPASTRKCPGQANGKTSTHCTVNEPDHPTAFGGAPTDPLQPTRQSGIVRNLHDTIPTRLDSMEIPCARARHHPTLRDCVRGNPRRRRPHHLKRLAEHA